MKDTPFHEQEIPINGEQNKRTYWEAPELKVIEIINDTAGGVANLNESDSGGLFS